MQPLPPKKEVALALLESSSVYVHLDPRKDGVVVPARFRTAPQLVLQVGLDMPIPIPDLDVGEEAISCTLSFSRVPFHCTVPWHAVYAIVGDDGRGMVWPDDVPAEVAEKAKPKEERAPALREVPPPAESAPSLAKETKAEPKPADGKPKRGKKRDAAEPEPDVRRRIVALAKDEPKDAPRREKPQEKKSPEPAAVPEPAAATTEPVAPEASEPREPPKKGKRELPPYLRVVK